MLKSHNILRCYNKAGVLKFGQAELGDEYTWGGEARGQNWSETRVIVGQRPIPRPPILQKRSWVLAHWHCVPVRQNSTSFLQDWGSRDRPLAYYFADCRFGES